MPGFENFNFVEWFLENILWVIVSGIFIWIFLKTIPNLLSAIKISKKILRDNRDTRGNGLGKYSADRFLDVWYSSDKLPLRYEGGTSYDKRFNRPDSLHCMQVIDQELMDLGLIKKGEPARGYPYVFSIQTRLNSMVAKFTQFYLTRFIGDNPTYYQNMAAQKRSSDKGS